MIGIALQKPNKRPQEKLNVKAVCSGLDFDHLNPVSKLLFPGLGNISNQPSWFVVLVDVPWKICNELTCHSLEKAYQKFENMSVQMMDGDDTGIPELKLR